MRLLRMLCSNSLVAFMLQDLDKTYGDLESARKGGDDLKQWQIEAKEQLKALSSEVSTLRKSVSKKEKVLEDLQRQHQGLQVRPRAACTPIVASV
jgi:uncharacterized coiled-coil DUF342 family protein